MTSQEQNTTRMIVLSGEEWKDWERYWPNISPGLYIIAVFIAYDKMCYPNYQECWN